MRAFLSLTGTFYKQRLKVLAGILILMIIEIFGLTFYCWQEAYERTLAVFVFGLNFQLAVSMMYGSVITILCLAVVHELIWSKAYFRALPLTSTNLYLSNLLASALVFLTYWVSCYIFLVILKTATFGWGGWGETLATNGWERVTLVHLAFAFAIWAVITLVHELVVSIVTYVLPFRIQSSLVTGFILIILIGLEMIFRVKFSISGGMTPSNTLELVIGVLVMCSIGLGLSILNIYLLNRWAEARPVR